MKKIIYLSFIMLLFVGGLAACSSNEKSASGSSASDSYPSEAISVIVAYDAGGGTDTTARALQPYLEEELGVPVNIINKPGGSGWVGWNTLANAKPDGQTIGYLNSPNIASGLVNPTMERKVNLDDFEALGNHVTDPGAIVIRVDEERFTNMKELVEYAKEHEVTTTATGVAGDDHLVTLKLNQKLDTNFRAIQFEGTAKSRSAFLGGHVDVLITSVGEAYTMHQNEKLKVVAVTAKERSSFLEDVPTVKEAGFEEVISQSTRGLAAPKGIPQEKLDILKEALKKAANNAEHVEKMKEIGTQVDYVDGAGYMEMLKQDKKDVEGLRDLLDW
ncbi:tripartite tricarboxylate transporter substrate binding protein [Halobacillus naozhouensis]|uniref:Tripartite tricarboxylate transporter substrate binding protein n=1 Tax=Halobacillus naozhouensis TaxID=554880 RepID=A0ABY8IYR7_9BACI|nr:tripartite tricarboxylate transporter substrate binding protein [Halobacillus naozhouensis]WFT74434.1 tripartite tricarboxylate transporter substrate binding protein [Halobacillus naozhouensis]